MNGSPGSPPRQGRAGGAPATLDRSFWAGRRVLVTGHTGFKGTWLAALLQALGAHVAGLSLAPEPGPSLFRMLEPWDGLLHLLGDVRDARVVADAVSRAEPSIVLHLAAQALVRRGWREPAATFATNVQGTVHLLQALRGRQDVQAAVVITSDKVYRNDAAAHAGRIAFREDDVLGGADPYSASKAAAELAVASWRRSYRAELPPLATARAGNVVGGGDFGEDRLLPDLARAQSRGEPLRIRHPQATRPWQHVLDVLEGYLLLAQRLATGGGPVEALNFGPSPDDGEASVAQVIQSYERHSGRAVRVEVEQPVPPVPESARLSLDPSLAFDVLGWRTRRSVDEGIAEAARWYGAWQRGEDMGRLTRAAAGEAIA